ncbi:MAG: response regulator [Polyangiaceae bacterium]
MSTRILVVDDSPTIRKVVASILERRGYETRTAGDGQRALDVLKSEAPEDAIDLVLLDFVMPRMNGFQFCRVLRHDAELAGTPVVLMSAKSDKIRERFVQQTGAIDAITKPFDAEALVALVENALRRVANRGDAKSSQVHPAEAYDVDDEGPKSIPVATMEVRAARATSALHGRLSELFGAGSGRASDPGASSFARDVATRLAEALTADVAREFASFVRDLDFGAGRVGLTGSLDVVPMGAILQLLQVECQTGTLTVRSPSSEIRVSLSEGMIDFVESRGVGEEFRLGRFFVESGLATPEEIEKVLREESRIEFDGPPPSVRPSRPPVRDASASIPAALDPGPESFAASRGRSHDPGKSVPPSRISASSPPPSAKPLLGDLMLVSGRITERDLRDALSRQSSELVYELLRWQAGSFEFRAEAVTPLALSAKLALPVAHVVMEGFRRVDEWRLVEAKLGNFDGILQVDKLAIDSLGDDAISKEERAVLALVDGERTVREVVAASHMSSFDACKILYQFIEARLVRRKGGGLG